MRQADLDLLGLEEPITKAEVEARFRDLAHKYHPDTAGTLGDADMLTALVGARDRVVEELDTPIRCDVCNGSGKELVMHGFATTRVKCSKCGGVGKVPRA